MGTDERPHKIQIYDDAMDQTQPATEPEVFHNDGDVAAGDIQPSSSSPANRGRTKFTSGTNHQAHSKHPKSSEPNSRPSPRFRSKRHTPATKLSDECQEGRSGAKVDAVKKEFPSKKLRPAQQCEKTTLAEPATTSSPPTSSIRDRFGDLIYEQQGASSSQSTHRNPGHVFQTNDSVFTSEQQATSPTNKFSLLQIQRRQRHCQSQSGLTYINDSQCVDAGDLESSQKLAFTVTDKEGKGIELTIAVYGASPLLTAVMRRRGDRDAVTRQPHVSSAGGNRYQNFTSCK